MYAVVRIKGGVNTKPKVKNTLGFLRLHRVNHCVLVPESAEYKGMIQNVKDYVAWGKVEPEVLSLILRKRAELEGGEPITDEYLANNTRFKSVEDFAKALCENITSMKEVPKLTPVLRLHPPRKGLKSTKRSVSQGGSLGNHGTGINVILKKMR